MQRKTPNDIVELIQNLYQQALSVAEIARRTQVSYATVWGYTAAKKKGFASYGAYQEDLAKKKGFASYGAYQEDLVGRRQQQAETQELSDLIKKRLKEIGKNQSWLAEEMGVSRQAVSLYIRRKAIPNRVLLKKLFVALNVNHQTLDDLLE